MNNKKFCIHHCAGSGGMFLLNLFANFLDLKKNTLDRSHGDYHDGGKGDWKIIDQKICSIGNYWDLNYKEDPDIVLYYTHRHEYLLTLKKLQPNVKIVAIDCSEDDYENVTKLWIKKAWPNLWTEQEYDKWVSAGCTYFPPYNKSNLNDPTVYKLVHSQLNLDTVRWHKNLDHTQIDYVINFKTIFGLDDQSLEDKVSSIIGVTTNNDVKKMIKDYQTLNKKLYF